MMTQGCAYCCGDLAKVDGLLGPEYFCPVCRRFQPRDMPRYALSPKPDETEEEDTRQEAGQARLDR